MTSNGATDRQSSPDSEQDDRNVVETVGLAPTPHAPTPHEASEIESAYYYPYEYQRRDRGEGFPGAAATGGGFPGWRILCAFFQSLRANLRLTDDDLHPMSTSASPLTPARSSSSAPVLQLPPSSSTEMTSNGNSTSTLTETIPPPTTEEPPILPLTTSITTSPQLKTEALHLIADSIAQQRQTASRTLIFHPLSLSLYVAILAVLSNYMWHDNSDLPLVFTTTAGLCMTVLIGIRTITQGYLSHAEAMKWSWLRSEGGIGELGEDIAMRASDDAVIVTQFGEEMIGAVVVRLEPSEQIGAKKSRGGKRSTQGGTALIRGWTTKLRYREKGVGRALLEEAVKLARETLGDSVEVKFADNHANSYRMLPFMFNGAFERREKRSRKLLQDVLLNKVDS